ncbi:MAG: hypothetical protein M1836_005208 [Candelina mexicana]|nr:MAG: hypothetical protein M1836_005208 [Candelina mexicana]
MALAMGANPSDGLHNRKSLPRLQTSFNNSSSRFQRPRPDGIAVNGDATSRSPFTPITPPVTRQAPKGGLLGLFSRSKSTSNKEADTSSPTLESFKEFKQSRSGPGSKSLVAVQTLPQQTIEASKSPVPPSPKIRNKSSRMTLRSRSQHKPISPRPITTWDPPPLFQAYPQAIRHASLQASTLAADSILRTHNHKRNLSLREEMMQSTVGLSSGDPESMAKRREQRSRSRHRRRLSGSFSNGDWTRKIYALVTSGYILQYAGDGTFDRLPEKILQLGKDSVAFASDVMPGKHWVLQISQASDGGETIATDNSTSFLSRWGLRGADARRATTSFLLVLDSAEEMDSWMMVVRREIEALGGKKYRPDIGARRKTDESTPQLRERPSRTYLIKRDPNQFGLPAQPDHSAKIFQYGREMGDTRVEEPSTETASLCSSRRYSSVRPSLETPSIATTVVSNDQLQLDGLRESSRLSYISAGTKTLTTSRGSSPATSPTNEDFSGSTKSSPGLKNHPKNMAVAAAAAAATEHQRRSVTIGGLGQSNQLSALEVLSTVRQSHSKSSQQLGEAPKGSSASPPNFSIPRSSKRCSSQLLPPTLRLQPTSRTQSDPACVKHSIQTSDNRPTSMVGNLPSHEDLFARPARSLAVDCPDHGPQVLSDAASPSLSRPTANLLETSPTITPTTGKSASPSRPVSTAAIIPRRFSSLEYSKGITPPSVSTEHLAPPTISEIENQQRPTSSHSANTKRKLRRPNSMQVRSSPLPAGRTLEPPQSQIVKSGLGKPQMQSRRSMPVLNIGPPPMPPPSCPLPAPPSMGVASERRSSDETGKSDVSRHSTIVE